MLCYFKRDRVFLNANLNCRNLFPIRVPQNFKY